MFYSCFYKVPHFYLLLNLFYMSTKTQTKTKTVSALGGKIQVENILQLSLVQSTLQANFKAILQALSEQHGDIQKNKDDNSNNFDKLSKMQGSQEKMNKQINSLKEIINRLSQQNADIKTKVSGFQQKNQPNPEMNPSKNETLKIQDLNKQLAMIKDKTDKIDQKIDKSSQIVKSDIEKLRKQLNEMKKISDTTNNHNIKLKELEKLMKQMQQKNKEIQKKILGFEKNLSSGGADKTLQKLRQLKERIQKLQDTKQNHQFRIGELEKQSEQYKSIVEQQRRLRSKLSQQLWKLHDTFSKVSENNLSAEMNNDLLKQLKKQVSEIQKRLGDMSGVSKNNFNDTTIHDSPSKYTLESPTRREDNGDLREQLLEKLKLMRSDLMKNMRKLDIKNEGESGLDKNRLDSIDEAILRLDHLLSDKANIDTVKKLIYNIQNKINYIYNMFLGDSEEDATIARRNWFCLSCDRKLDKYQGKVGNHLISNQLKSKTLEQDTVGGGMVLKSAKSKLDLPKVFSSNLKKL